MLQVIDPKTGKPQVAALSTNEVPSLTEITSGTIQAGKVRLTGDRDTMAQVMDNLTEEIKELKQANKALHGENGALRQQLRLEQMQRMRDEKGPTHIQQDLFPHATANKSIEDRLSKLEQRLEPLFEWFEN